MLVNNNARATSKKDSISMTKSNHRSRRAKFTAIVLAMYVGFVGFCAFAPKAMSIEAAPGIPFSLLVGPGIIVVLMGLAVWDMCASRN